VKSDLTASQGLKMSAVEPLRRKAMDYDIAVIGAGPYGLSAGAHLKASGVNVRVFGEPMQF